MFTAVKAYMTFLKKGLTHSRHTTGAFHKDLYGCKGLYNFLKKPHALPAYNSRGIRI
jgi:hypothetical protein